MFFNNHSTTSLNSTTSSSPLLAKQKSTKDYQAAFSSLQTTYGGSGLSPLPVHALPTSHKSSSSKSPKIQLTPQEAALGQLASQYGFCGASPVVPRKSAKPSSSTSYSQTSSPLQAPKANPGQKDYAAAFAALSSHYGSGLTGHSKA